MSVDVEERTLYIANLDRSVTEELLYELFLQAGPVEKVNIPGNSNDNRYGFVTYKHEVSIDYALKLYEGTRLYKKELVIKRKGERANNQQNRFGDMMNQGLNLNQPNFDQLLAFSQFLMPNNMNAQRNYSDSPNRRNDRQNSFQRQRPNNRNRPYDRDGRNHPRSREHRYRDKRY